MKNQYWFDNDDVLFTNYKNIIPRENMTYQEKTNSIVRLSFIIGLLLSLVFKTIIYMLIPLVSMILTCLLYLVSNKTIVIKNRSNFENIAFENMTFNNHYM
jgi:hypothetical protein